MLQIILLINIVLLIAAEFATFHTYGFVISKEMSNLFMNLNPSTMSLNQYDSSILNLGFGPNFYVSKVPFSIICKYQISDVGVVPRFSKLHYKIEKYYVLAMKKQLQDNVDNFYISSLKNKMKRH